MEREMRGHKARKEEEKETAVIDRRIKALEAQKAILEGKTVYLKQVCNFAVKKNVVENIQVSNIGLLSLTWKGEAIIDVRFREGMGQRLMPADDDYYEFIIEG